MLTFEKIRELERGEREAKQLQKMPENFFDDLADYLKKKEEINEKTSTDIMEIENVKAAIRRLFEIRERKMMELMIYTLRTGMIPENYRGWLAFNPMYHVATAYQNVLVYNRAPEWKGLLMVAVLGMVLLGFSLLLFRRASAEMVDAL